MSTLIFSLVILVLLLIGIFRSYDGNPIKGLIGIWCSLTKYHEKEFKKTNKNEFFFCKRCNGSYYEGSFKNII
jgi:hypothetical protein